MACFWLRWFSPSAFFLPHHLHWSQATHEVRHLLNRFKQAQQQQACER